MKKRIKIIDLSLLIFASIVLIHATLALAFSENLEILSLKPASVIARGEYYRLISYIFAPDRFADYLLFALSFIILASKTFNSSTKTKFALALALATLFGGLFAVALEASYRGTISGIAVLSFFVLTAFAIKNRNRSLLIFKKIKIEALSFSLITALVWAALLTFEVRFLENRPLDGSVFLLPLSGIIWAAAIEISSFSNKSEKKIYDDFDFIPDIPTPEELAIAFIKKENLSSSETKIDVERRLNSYAAEEKLDAILDKILERGTQSLSDEEKRFLEEFSKKRK